MTTRPPEAGVSYRPIDYPAGGPRPAELIDDPLEIDYFEKKEIADRAIERAARDFATLDAHSRRVRK